MRINQPGWGSGPFAVSKGSAAWTLVVHREAQTRSSLSSLRALGSFPGKYTSDEEKPCSVKQGQNFRESLFREGGTLQHQERRNTGSATLQLGQLGSGLASSLWPSA